MRITSIAATQSRPDCQGVTLPQPFSMSCVSWITATAAPGLLSGPDKSAIMQTADVPACLEPQCDLAPQPSNNPGQHVRACMQVQCMQAHVSTCMHSYTCMHARTLQQTCTLKHHPMDPFATHSHPPCPQPPTPHSLPPRHLPTPYPRPSGLPT